MKNAWKKTMIALFTISLTACSNPVTKEQEVNVVTTNDQTTFEERFVNPNMSDKALTRWWVPGAKMEKEEIKKEILSMVNAGLGGAEIVPVSLAGGDGEGEIDWGSDEWKETTKYILETAAQYNFTIDFTMTPAWPLALPTIQDVNDISQGAQMELDGAWQDGISKTNPFKGKLPMSEEVKNDVEKVDGKVTLIGITIAKYVDKENKVLSYESATSLDLSKVKENEDGTYSFEFTPEEEGEYVLYAWYQHPSGNQKYGNNQVDHYSKAGAQMIIDYWENELIPYYGEAWSACRSLFIDSLEYETHLDWTQDLQNTFENTFDYDIVPYLAGVYDSSDEWTAIGNYMGDPVSTFTFDQNTTQIQNDFKENLTQMYIENHIKPLEEFCKKNGVTLRYQTAYGKNLELSNTAMYPDIPETETLYGNDYMDFYRLQAGSVHATDKNIYSLETAAEWTETWNAKKDNGEYGTRGNGESNSGNYEQTFLDHLWHDQRAYASGVNQVVLHGYPYSGEYNGEALEGTQWPGFTGFDSSRWSNSWGERQPNWMFAQTYLDYLARTQVALREGTPKVDLAIYHHSYYETIDFWGPDKLFKTESLEQNGYSYDFISPAILELDNMTVKDGVLDSEGSEYKALVFDNESELSSQTIERLIQYAENGLTIVFVGKTPIESTTVNDAYDVSKMEQLLASDHVKQVESVDDVLEALKEADVLPDAKYENETLLVNHRSDEDKEIYYLYNYGDSNKYPEVLEAETVETTVVLQGEGKPYLANAWTGEIEAIEDYKESDQQVEVSVKIAPNDTNIVILSKEDISNTKKESTETISKDISLGNWNLTVESWTKGETVLDTQKTKIEVGTLDTLKTWDQIEGLENVSGVGEYTTTFETNEDYQEGQIAYIHMGQVKDAYNVEINGKSVVVDQASGIADISEYLIKGKNEIKVTVATSLLNAILEENKEILNDEGRVLDDRHNSSYGLSQEIYISATK